MAVTIILAAGLAAELVLALVRPLRGAVRGLVCWSVAAVVLEMCCIVYFAGASEIVLDFPGVIRCVGGAGVVVLISALIELFSPSRRSRERARELSADRAERSLNIVLSVASGLLCVSSLGMLVFGERDTAAVLLVPPASAAIRQTMWFMRAYASEQQENRREKLTQRISGEKYRL